MNEANLVALPSDVWLLIGKFLKLGEKMRPNLSLGHSAARTCRAANTRVTQSLTSLEINGARWVKLGLAADPALGRFTRVTRLFLELSSTTAFTPLLPLLEQLQVLEVKVTVGHVFSEAQERLIELPLKCPRLHSLSIASTTATLSSDGLERLTTLRELRLSNFLVAQLDKFLTRLSSHPTASTQLHVLCFPQLFAAAENAVLGSMKALSLPNLTELDFSSLPVRFDLAIVRTMPLLKKLCLCARQLGLQFTQAPREDWAAVIVPQILKPYADCPAVANLFITSDIARFAPKAEYSHRWHPIPLLFYAVQADLVDEIADMISIYNADPKIVGPFGYTALHVAFTCTRDDSVITNTALSPRVIEVLLSKGADPNRFVSGRSVLHLAVAARAPLEVLALLAKFGARFDSPSVSNKIPFEELIESAPHLTPETQQVAEWMIQKGAAGDRLHSLTKRLLINNIRKPVKFLLSQVPQLIKERDDQGLTFAHYLACNYALLRDFEWIDSLRPWWNWNEPSSPGGWTPLSVACWLGETKSIGGLLQAGAQPGQMVSSLGMTTSTIAHFKSHQFAFPIIAEAQEVSKSLLEGLNPNEANTQGWTTVHYAALMSQYQYMANLLKIGADIFAPSASGITPLMLWCTDKDSTKTVDDFWRTIDRKVLGAKINARTTPTGFTALHFAASNGTVDLIELLLNFGADINARDNEGLGALEHAILTNETSIAQFLIKRGAAKNPTPLASDGVAAIPTPLFLATYMGRESLIDALIATGADVNQPCHIDSVVTDKLPAFAGIWRPIHAATATIHEATTLSALITKGTKTNVVGGVDGAYPLHLLCSKSYVDLKVVEPLVAASPEVINHPLVSNGYTPVMLAELHHNTRLVELLVANGADPTVVAKDGHTLFSVAAANTFAEHVLVAAKLCKPIKPPIFKFSAELLARTRALRVAYERIKNLDEVCSLEDAFTTKSAPPALAEFPADLRAAFHGHGVSLQDRSSTAPAFSASMFTNVFGAFQTPGSF